jgi:hypothetical protein
MAAACPGIHYMLSMVELGSFILNGLAVNATSAYSCVLPFVALFIIARICTATTLPAVVGYRRN